MKTQGEKKKIKLNTKIKQKFFLELIPFIIDLTELLIF